jgi:hypothetical protein
MEVERSNAEFTFSESGGSIKESGDKGSQEVEETISRKEYKIPEPRKLEFGLRTTEFLPQKGAESAKNTARRSIGGSIF